MNNDFLHDVLGNGGVRIALVGVLAILALFLFMETASLAENFGRPVSPATDTITVTGDGHATLAPDIAHITFSVENSAATVGDAQAATTKQANAALTFVTSQGVADKDVKTLSYNISPQYSYPAPCPAGALCPVYGGTPKVIGYQVSETIQVTLRDLTKVGAFLAGVGKLEVQNVSGPDFALDNANAGSDAARADAITNAKQEALVLAKQLGVTLGKIVNFSESSGGYPYPVLYGASADSRGAAVPPQVPAGENTYSASVSITYEIR
ncbi:SIMPL domain-containing protein [Candidatus Kaiserbacteria bacterium]|nr:SIMPL domain-containing protein [Candidatus Kaiserbacteria bacterium]